MAKLETPFVISRTSPSGTVGTRLRGYRTVEPQLSSIEKHTYYLSRYSYYVVVESAEGLYVCACMQYYDLLDVVHSCGWSTPYRYVHNVSGKTEFGWGIMYYYTVIAQLGCQYTKMRARVCTACVDFCCSL